jgi:GNAT superfamily N-acetyltransferase
MEAGAFFTPGSRPEETFCLKEAHVTDGFRIREADADPAIIGGLADVLMDCVEGGASVSFMAPLDRNRAVAFWRGAFDSASRGERVVLIAEDAATDRVVGTVQVFLAMPDNQPHRAEIAKLLVHRDARCRGLGRALMRAAEDVARVRGRTLLVLDTATGGDAERLYARLGWQQCGVIPGYALLPHGGLCDTTLFYRELPGARQTSKAVSMDSGAV